MIRRNGAISNADVKNVKYPGGLERAETVKGLFVGF